MHGALGAPGQESGQDYGVGSGGGGSPKSARKRPSPRHEAAMFGHAHAATVAGIAGGGAAPPPPPPRRVNES